VKTVGRLFERLCDPEHLERAMRLTTRGKRRRGDVAWFLLYADRELARIRTELCEERWEPAPFDVLRLRDPKPRAIARTSIEDRVVHAALAVLLEEVWAPRLLPADMACRRGFGTHRARLALQRHLRRHRTVVHLDIRAYFASVDLDGLRSILARRIRDGRFLAVMDRVLWSGAGLVDSKRLRGFLGLDDAWPPRSPPGLGSAWDPDDPPASYGRGLPIGAYTSQVLATHVVLCDFDHFVKRDLKVPGYTRYVDDIFAFGDRRADLRRWRVAIAQWLKDERDLRLKHPDAPILSGAGTLDGLGARITREGIAPGPKALRRLRKRVRERLRRRGDAAAFRRSVVSSVGGMLR